MLIPFPNLPSKHNLKFMFFFVHHCVSHKIACIYFLIQKRGSRKGSIDIKNIRCVEKVNLEEQTPVERQYPFQVRGEATFHWMDGSSFNILYYELNIVGINKDVAKLFTRTMTRLGTLLDRSWECAYSTLGKWLELSEALLLLHHE